MVEIEEEHKCEGKVSIIKVQADELTKKDQYIEQLENKIKFLQTEKKNVSFKIEDDIIEENSVLLSGELSGGLSEGLSGGLSEGLSGGLSEGLSGGWSPTSNKKPSLQEKEIVKEEEENQMDIDDEVKEDLKEEEEDDDDEIEYKRIKYKGERYYIVVGEEPQIVYKILEDEDVGLRVGIRKKKTKGTGYSIDFD